MGVHKFYDPHQPTAAAAAARRAGAIINSTASAPSAHFDESIAPFKVKSITISWEMMFTRSLFQTADMDAQHRMLKEVSALVEAGVLRTTLSRVMGHSNLREVHESIETGRAIGKFVLDGF
jgi:NADPH:quinone reductase-like Zn-dependent oxidoreductase